MNFDVFLIDPSVEQIQKMGECLKYARKVCSDFKPNFYIYMYKENEADRFHINSLESCLKNICINVSQLFTINPIEYPNIWDACIERANKFSQELILFMPNDWNYKNEMVAEAVDTSCIIRAAINVWPILDLADDENMYAPPVESYIILGKRYHWKILSDGTKIISKFIKDLNLNTVGIHPFIIHKQDFVKMNKKDQFLIKNENEKKNFQPVFSPIPGLVSSDTSPSPYFIKVC